MKKLSKILVLVLVLATFLTTVAVFTASAATPEKLYLTPNSNWKVDNARFAAYFFGNGEKWVSMTYNSELGVYEVDVPAGYPSVIFCRMNPNASANNWNNKWNQTADLTVPTNGTNHYTVKEGTWDKGGGTWGTLIIDSGECQHKNTTTEEAKATCTTDGYKKVYCSDCEQYTVNEAYPATGHTYSSSTDNACNVCSAAPTWTVAGSGAHLGTEWDTGNVANDMKYDSATGAYTKVYENVAAGSYALKVVRDHDWGTAYPSADKAYTVSKAGSTVTVTLKGTTVTVNVEAPHTHSWSDATCTEPQKCSCGETQGEALGHNVVTDAYKAPTCTETGLTEGSHCTRCDAMTVAQEEISATGHRYSNLQVIPATCTEDGYIIIGCGNCDGSWSSANNDQEALDYLKSPVGQFISLGKASHNLADAEGKDPTCTEAGYSAHKACTRCDYTEGKEVIPVVDHVDEDPRDHECDVCGLCTSDCADANKNHKCDICDDVMSKCADNDKNHFCDYCGVQNSHCIDIPPYDHNCDWCGEKMSEHNYVDGVCDVCGAAAPHEHSWSDATCTEPKKCACGETDGEALGHAWENCECTRCDAVLSAVDLGEYNFAAMESNDRFGLVGAFRPNGDNHQFNANSTIQFVAPANTTVTIVGHSAQYGVFNVYVNGEKTAIVGSHTFTVTEETKFVIATGDNGASYSYIKSVVVAEYVDRTIKEDTEITFGSEGNYKDSIVDFSGIHIGDNGGNNSQVKNGSFDLILKAGAKVVIHGYRGYTSYSLNGGAEITDEYYTYVAAEDTVLTVTPVSGNNYFYSISITYHVHNYEAVVTAPTCTAGGYTTYTCECGETYVADEVGALGHSFADGTCGVCGAADPDYVEPDTGLQLEFTSEPGTGYEINGLNIKYNGLGNTYKPVTASGMAALATGKNTFTVTITNNGTESVRVRFDIQGTTWVSTGDGSGTDACNISSVGGDSWTDTTWGGSVVTVPAGESVTLTITYSSYGPQGLVKNILCYVDSARGDGATYSADITLSGIEFGGEEVAPEPKPDDPKPDTGLQFDFWTSSNDYTTNGNNIKYNGAGNSYSCAGTDIANLAKGHTTFTVTITNNGTADARVRVDIQATTQVGNHTVCNVSATGGDVWTDAEWGGSIVTVPAGQSVTLVIEYDEYSERGAVTNLVIFADSARGDANVYNTDITLSEMAFSGESVAPHVHNYTSVVTAPTCLAGGYTTYTCECGDTYVADEVAALGHDMITDAAVAPTCTEAGLTEGSHCSRCDHKVAQTVVPAAGHTAETVAGKAATCTETGLTEGKKCSACGETLIAQTETPVVAHTYDDKYDESCNVCGFTRDVTCDHEGTIVKLDGKAATCTEAGLTEGKKCTRCEEILVAQEVIDALGHSEEVVAGKDATCTETGLTEGKKCSVCGETLVAQTEIPATGHTEEAVAGKDATCTEAGLTEGKKCSVCGETLVAQEEIPATGHSYVDGKCECGAEDPDYVAPHEHEFVNGKCECGEVDPDYEEPTEPSEPTEPGDSDDKDEEPVQLNVFQKIVVMIKELLAKILGFFKKFIKF